MTDNDIIKAYEICLSGTSCYKRNCPFFDKCDTENLSEYILDVLNRQKAELERLERHTEMYHEVRDEAVKEVVKRIKKCSCVAAIDQDGRTIPESVTYTIREIDLDKIASEIKEGLT